MPEVTAEAETELVDSVTEQEQKSQKKDAADERIADLETQNADLAAQMAEMKAMLEQALSKPSTPQPDFLDPDPNYVDPFSGAPAASRNKTIMMTIRELRAFEGPLYVRNNDPQRQFSCHQQLGEHRVDFDLGPKGNIKGDDITFFPKLALEIRGIHRAIFRGAITVSSDEAMEDEIMLAMGQHMHTSEDQLQELLAPLTPGNNARDVVPMPCCECGSYTIDPMTNQPSDVIQGGQVFQSYEEYKTGKPPLCPMHESQSHLWASSMTEDPATGFRDWVFEKVAAGAARPGVQPGRPQFDQGAPRARVRRVGKQP